MAFSIRVGYPMLEFEWDIDKQALNVEKHGVAFSDAVETFGDPSGFEIFDTNHSLNEERFLWIGKDSLERILTTWYTRRENKIRIIGSAKLRKFRRLNYENSKNS